MNIKTNTNSRTASNSIYLERMSEPFACNANGINIGKGKIYKMPFILDLNNTINKNIAVLGMSGSGKSYFLKSFVIKSNLQRRSTVLIIDWNNEYKEVVEFLGGNVLTFGSNLKINIFDLYSLESLNNIKEVTELINYLLNLDDEEKYKIYNTILLINSTKSKDKILNLNSLIDKLKKEGTKTSDKLSIKLQQLKQNPIFSEKTSFPVNTILDNVTSINFSMLKDDSQRNETSRFILKLIIELMHNIEIGKSKKENESIILLDEAWRLLKNSEDVGVLFREGRKYDFCVAVATQLANDINNEILSNSACLFLFRLQNDNDYKLLLNSGVISEKDKNEVMLLPVGSCMVSLALKESNGAISKFFLGRTDGIATNSYLIKGGSMQIRISNKAFLDSTKRLMLGNETKDKIINFMANNSNEVEDVAFIEYLISLKVERPEIIYYLRTMGLKDEQIIKAYDNAVPFSLE